VSFSEECAFGELAVAETLASIVSPHRERLQTVIEQIRKTGFFDRHKGFLDPYEGLSIQSWAVDADGQQYALQFQLTYTNHVQQQSIAVCMVVRQHHTTLSVILLDRSGNVDDSGSARHLDVTDICAEGDELFSARIDASEPFSAEVKRIVARSLARLEGELSPLLDGTLTLADTDLSRTSIEQVQTLMKRLSHIDAEKIVGRSPLCQAIQAQRNDLVEFLLREGASRAGTTCFAANLEAPQQQIIEVLQILREAGADLDEEHPSAGHVRWHFEEMETALSAAARRDHLDVARWLLKNGAVSPAVPQIQCNSPAMKQVIGSGLGRHRIRKEWSWE